MLLQVQDDGSLKNMHVTYYPELVRFFTSLIPKDEDDPNPVAIGVKHSPVNGPEKSISIPISPETNDLEQVDVTMHKSPTKAHNMGAIYNDWFSSCLGYNVILAYLGQHTRQVLMSTSNTTSEQPSWLSSLTARLPTAINDLLQAEKQITFADCAPYLVVSSTSLSDVSARLPEGEEMDAEKFRPNIIVAGAAEAWEEDYWGEIAVGETRLDLVQNCVRCQSINIDFATGRPGTGEAGKVLGKLQKDRRVDTGAKYSPVFGRYSFLGKGCEGKVVRVGDEVVVTKRNGERTRFDWPGLGTS